MTSRRQISTIQTGFCMHPSPGSHRYCDTLVNDDTRTVTCACDCHNDMAPFDVLDAELKAHYDARLTPADIVAEPEDGSDADDADSDSLDEVETKPARKAPARRKAAPTKKASTT